jgi:hypothetical protein
VKNGILLFLVAISFLLIGCYGYEKSTEIKAENLSRLVHDLASDEMEGRGAGYDGDRLAAEYLAIQFKAIGLEPIANGENVLETYFQPFTFYTLADTNPWQSLKSQNIAGILRGSEFPDEYIVVGGHIDGQGLKSQADLGKSIPEGIITDKEEAKRDTIWNSAVDNAVSIAAVVEIARVLRANEINLKRSIIFTGFSAEESSLDGSVHFVNNPPIASGKIKAMVNLEKIVGDPDAEFLYVSFSTNPVFETIRKKNDSLKELKMNPFYPGIIANTDHYPFLMRKIPAVTIGTGSQINIHTSLDHADRLDYALLKSRTEYILDYIIELVNCEKYDYEFTGSLDLLTGVAGGPATKEEMLSRGFQGERAFKVANIVKGTKGYNAGLSPEDLVISVNGQLVKEKPFYTGLEDAISIEEIDGEYADLEVLRDGKKITLRLEIK